MIFDEDMGPDIADVPSFRTKRAVKALADLNRGEQKQARKVAEDIQKVKVLWPKLNFYFDQYGSWGLLLNIMT